MGPFDPKRTGRERLANPHATASNGHAPRAASERRIALAQVSRPEEEEARASSRYRAALEALFAPKKPEPAAEVPPDRSSVKRIALPPRASDPRAHERERRVAKLLAAEGRAAVTKATDDLLHAGLPLPDEEDVLLKVLDHADEDRVRDALLGLERLLGVEAAKRRALLDARLRRLAEDAEDGEVRALAARVRRTLAERGR